PGWSPPCTSANSPTASAANAPSSSAISSSPSGPCPCGCLSTPAMLRCSTSPSSSSASYSAPPTARCARSLPQCSPSRLACPAYPSATPSARLSAVLSLRCLQKSSTPPTTPRWPLPPTAWSSPLSRSSVYSLCPRASRTKTSDRKSVV